ncbi:MAG: hypothetical protein HC819_22695 [Cyclobacteriaceae bacterium]|nr:hypothetical protein [Cyclobacteriaceae bacterium]
MKTRILILYDYFDPAYKAGGPIRSLVNLVKLLDGKVELHILSTNQDHDGTVLAVTPDIWLDYGTSTKVKYLSPSKRSYHSIKKEFNDIHPTVVYLNGIFFAAFCGVPFGDSQKSTPDKNRDCPPGDVANTIPNDKTLEKEHLFSGYKVSFSSS